MKQSNSSEDTDADVAIAGAGPTGLLLAAELAMRGVRVVVLERNAERPDFVRAFNLNRAASRSSTGAASSIDSSPKGPKVPFTHFAALDDTARPRPPRHRSPVRARHPADAHRGAARGARARAGRGDSVGARRRRPRAGRRRRDDRGERPRRCGGRPHTNDYATLRARWLVGCDGGRSTVRKRAGIAFPGTAATRWALLGDVELEDPASLSFGNHQTSRGGGVRHSAAGLRARDHGELAPPAIATRR